MAWVISFSLIQGDISTIDIATLLANFRIIELLEKTEFTTVVIAAIE
ncbi:hypothetical protein [Anaplasma marginale]|nr:hypothetical protein [Anaplasma marginale]